MTIFVLLRLRFHLSAQQAENALRFRLGVDSYPCAFLNGKWEIYEWVESVLALQ